MISIPVHVVFSDNDFEDSLKNAKNTAIEMEMLLEFLEKRRHKIKTMVKEEAIDEGAITVHTIIKHDFYMTRSFRV